MSTASDLDSGNRVGQPYLWILFLILFLVLLVVSLLIIYKRGGCVCQFHVNTDAYRQERESLQRLRELRQRHHEISLETFTQIPGPIPDARLQQQRAAISNLTSLGFILVTPAVGDTSSMNQRDQLTVEQRRDILERLLSCRTYHVTTEELMSTLEEQQVEEDENDASSGSDSENKEVEGEADASETTPPAATTYAFPLHEEPEEPEKTCAICLDDFVEGEIINDASKCPHVFHKACLIAWLDRHTVCPCCRCTMITDSEWRRAAARRRQDDDDDESTPDERGENNAAQDERTNDDAV